MAERSSSASVGEHSKVFQVGKGSKNEKRRRGRRQKNEKLPEQSLENVQAAESSLLSTAEHSESNPNLEEFVQKSGEHVESVVQTSEKEMTAELNERESGVLEASAPNLAVAEGTSDCPKDLPSEDNLVDGKRKELPEKAGADASDDGEEILGSAENKSGEQQQTSTKKKKDLLSFRRSKKNKTQRSNKASQKASDEQSKEIKDSVRAEGDSGSRAVKGKENVTEPEDREMVEPRETSAMKEVDNSPEDGKTVENNEGPIGESERVREMDATESNKAKKFKPLASFRRHKKKADAPKSASTEENTEEIEDTKEYLKAASDDEENGDKISNNEEDEKTELNVKRKSSGKKFGPLRSFRRSKATKKSTAAGSDSAGTTKEKNENIQEKDTAKEENCQGSEVLQEEHGAQQFGADRLCEECTGEDVELLPEEKMIQNKCDADVEGETVTPTKKAKKKGLLRRQMKKMWSTSGKNKEASSVEKAESVVNEGTQEHNSEHQESSRDPTNPLAEDEGATKTLATEQERSESMHSNTTAENKTEKADEISPEGAATKDCSAEMTEKTASLFGRQIKKIKPRKKGKDENETKKEDEENLIEKSSEASDEDNKETSKQVKRKKSGFQKISDALKKKRTRLDGWQEEDQAEAEAEAEGLREKELEETDYQIASAEVSTAEDKEQRPSNHSKADAQGHEENGALQSDQEDTEKVDEIDECPSEEEEFSQSLERQNDCQTAGATEAYKAHGNLMKPVIQELLVKIAKIQVVRASASAEPEVEPEEDSEFTETSDDYSLTEVTSTTDDSIPSFVDTCSEGKDSLQLEGKSQERHVSEADHDGKPSDETTDAGAVEESSECVPSTPEAEQETPRPDETPISEIPKCDADVNAVPTSIPEEVPNVLETEPNGKRATTEDVENVEEAVHRGSEGSEEGDNAESEASKDEQERQIANSEDLNKSHASVTSDLDSSQAAPSKGRKEDWILVNHLEISQELSHQLKAFALDSFEHGTPGCCSMM